ncbi:glycosyltransferase family 39 protein [bacterium]|nr:glycosyltransferase family 39 protein [candidate division CSSED10-310 bacterium]
MENLRLLAVPFNYLIRPWIALSIPAILMLCLIGIILDWIRPVIDRQRGRLTLMLAAVAMFVVRDQYVSQSAGWSIALVSGAAVCLIVCGIVYRRSIRDDWTAAQVSMPFWIGLVIILCITWIKTIDLATWPPYLKAYSAMTGRWGMMAVEGHWPENLFQGRGFDLRGGGESPLMLPVMWLVMSLCGVTVWSVRFSEVIGSTVLLLVLWAWLRRSVPGMGAVAGLILFGLSPWHLAQSRMGTFFSISVAVAVGILWTSRNACEATTPWKSAGWWAAFGILTGSIGWCYAPMKVLYLYFFLVVAGVLVRAIANRNRESRFSWRLVFAGAPVGAIMFGLILTLQMSAVRNPSSMFKSHFGPLATDNPVWRKTVDDQVGPDRQPIPVIAANIRRNAVHWMETTFKENGILPLYAPALIVAMVICLVAIINRWSVLTSAYFLIGMLPPLIIFPLHRRTLLIWPLVYMAAVVLIREIGISGAHLFRRRTLKRIAPVLTGICLILMILQGFQIWIATWSIVKDHPYFGPPWRLRAMDRAAELMPTHSVVFINPWVHRDTIEITLYELNKKLGLNSLNFAGISEQSHDLRRYIGSQRPTAFIYFDLDNQSWLKGLLMQDLPGGVLEEVRNESGRFELLYSVYIVH